ncbi:DUF7693 family protein [Pseudomonas japonica]|uniref:DUF7693 family protein n=1 Tax=Pseudomonas japonica TaxID=256466 RepID=UPI004046DEFB
MGDQTRCKGIQAWDDVYACQFCIEVDGRRLLISNDSDSLGYCHSCVAPDGRRWDFDSSQRFGTDPVGLMSIWEHASFERVLKTL